jgi:N6-adenosine-specific RNA methylase IME4
VTELSIELIRIDGGTQSRASMAQNVIDDYADAILNGAKFPPIVVFHDGEKYWLADGFHRHGAYVKAGSPTIEVDIREGTVRDARLFSLGSNVNHGLRRTNEDKRYAVALMFEDEEWRGWSDSEIARKCGVSHPFVARMRDTCNVSSIRTFSHWRAGETTMDTSDIGRSSVVVPYDEREEEKILEAAANIRIQRAEKRRAEVIEISNRRVAVPDDKYSVIVIDPPWDMEKIERDVRPNQVEFDYPTMNEEELVAFGETVNKLAADDCHMFMWTTQKFLPMAQRLVESYGFRYVLEMVWHKPGGFQPIGLPQYNCEFVVYARKGFPTFVDTKDFPCCFQAPRREHSRKPDEFYDTIRRVTDGQRIDVFSREKRDGFDQFGNEADKFSGAA